MKKLSLTIVSAVLLISCQKEYQCECTSFYTSTGASFNVSTATYKTTKEKALEKCAQKEAEGTTPTMYRICNLK